MLQRPQVTFSLSNLFAVLLLSLLFSSCAITFIRKAPKDKPFVYKTNIRVEGNVPGNEKRELEIRLNNQLDDSLRSRVRSYPLWKTISRPPVFDTNNVNRSHAFMRALMNSLGYFGAVIKDTFTIDSVKDQKRVTVDFRINPGPGLRFDSIAYSLETPEWQRLALANRDKSLLVKNSRYSKLVVGEELDRMIELLRNNGYYKVTKEDIYAEADTVAFGLIDPTLDPFEQAILIQQLREKQQNPTVNVVIRQRLLNDTTHIKPFHIDDVTIYPDVPLLRDTSVPISLDTTRIGRFTIITQSNKFRKNFLLRYTYLKPGQLYRQSDYFRTITTFNQLGAWQQANVDVFEDPEKDSALDVEVTLYPAKKFGLILDLETSLNNANATNAALVATSNLFGIGFNVGLRNRNFARQSIQSTSNARVGVELGKNFVQTVQASLAQNFYFPKFIAPFRVKYPDSLISPRTILSFNTAYTDRRNFFKLASANVAWGYEWGRNNHIWFWRPFNIEYTNLTKRDSLKTLLDLNPSLRYAFNDGLVLGFLAGQGVYRWQKTSPNHAHFIRAAVEESGAILGLIKNLDINKRLFRFLKTDAQYSYNLQFSRSAVAFRVMAGVGFAYGDSSATAKERTLPFFKQFFAGGPNSMRAWQVRQLGWGSNKTEVGNLFDRFGDVQLEANIEYRFPITSIAGFKIGSALYVDMGNVWLRNTYGDPKLENAEFNLGRLGKDLAIGTGTGLRVDFGYFLIRVDYAYRVKDPNRVEEPGKLFYNWKIFNGQLQLGVNYPF